MPKQVVLLSGPVASGKTTLAQALVERYGFHPFKTRQLIQSVKEVKSERRALQRAGDVLDRDTNGEWIAQAVASKLQSLPEDCSIVIGAVRIKKQIDALRRAFGSRVVHIHLTASEEELRSRYENGGIQRSVEELKTYADVRKNKTERLIEQLAVPGAHRE